MIKPVYFGDKKLDQRRLDFINNQINNFSEWVKDKIDNEMKIETPKESNIDIEKMIRKILNEKIDVKVEKLEQDETLILIEQKETENINTENEENFNTNGWIL